MSHSRLVPLAVLVFAGCGQPGPQLLEAPVPNYDPEATARAMLAEFDRDGNGSLDPAEVRACPALARAFMAFDTNGDRRLSLDELRARVRAYAASATGSVGVGCLVRLDDRPLDGATVTFVPEPCMGAALKPAVGTTDADGRCAEYRIDGKTYRGLAPGLYQIRVTRDGAALPARFNTQTMLGREVFHDPRAAEVSVELALTSR